MNLKKSAIRGVAVTWVTQLLQFLVQFLTTPILLHHLGDEQYGIWSILMAMNSYYGLVSMGFGTASTKYIAEFDERADESQLSRLMSTQFAVYLLLSAIVAVLALVASIFFPSVFGTGNLSLPILRWVVFLTGLKVALDLIGQVFQSTIMAKGLFSFSNTIGMVNSIAVAICCAVLVTRGYGLIGMSVVVVVFAVSTLLATVYVALFRAGMPRFSPFEMSRQLLRMLFKFTSLTMLIQTARRMSQKSGGLIIGALHGPGETALFAPAESLLDKTQLFGRVITQVLMPITSRLDVTGRNKAIQRLFFLSSRSLLAAGMFLMIACCIFGEPFIRLWLRKPEFTAATPAVLAILSVLTMLKMPLNTMHATLTGKGRVDLLSRLSILEVIAIVVLGFALVPKLGMIGMAVALTAAYILTTGWILPTLLCREIECTYRDLFDEMIYPAVLSAAPVALAGIFISRVFPVQASGSFFELLMYAAPLGLISVVSYFYLCLDQETRHDVAGSLLSKLLPSSRVASPSQVVESK